MQDTTNKTKLSFFKLAQLLEVNTSYGWIKDLARKLDITENNLSNWIHRNKIPGKKLLKIEKESFPLEMWYDPPVVVLESATETAANSKTVSITKNNTACTTTSHEQEHKEYFKLLEEILESDDEETKQAIISNLKAFVRTVRMNRWLLQIDNPENENNSGSK